MAEGGGGTAGGAALAAAPIVLILVAMLWRTWSAARAGAFGLALAVVLAATAFDWRAPAPYAWVAAEGAFLSATILWILWPALALHLHQQRIGALDRLRAGLQQLAPEPVLQALLVGWFLALFFEGAAGFGTPVALAAPVLVGLGVAPLRAVVIALLGHAAGVSFGALGTPATTQVALTGVDAVGLAWRTALLHTLLGMLLMAFFVRALPEQVGAGRQRWAWGAFAAAAFLLPSLAIAAWLGPELPTLAGALLGGAAFALALRARTGAAPSRHEGATGGFARAVAPYAVLVALVLVTRAIPAIAARLGDLVLQWQHGPFGGRMAVLTHPGTLLFAAMLIGAALQRAPRSGVVAALRESARRLVPVTLALLAMLCLSRLMLHAGLVQALERAAVAGLGGAWPLVAPAVGALGSFVTGSATASNVLLTSLQAQTAQSLALPVTWIVAAQNFGAAVGNMICPHNIVAGAATVGAAGREAEILRRTLLPCLAYLALGGALLFVLLRLAAAA